MKKMITLTVLLVLGAGPLWASTCETRVDSHQQATTLQRVNYCLTPEAEPQETPQQVDMIYYGVVDKSPTAEPEKSGSSRQQTYYTEKNMAVYRDYVGTERFPTLKNDIQSEQEIQQQKQAQALAAATQPTKETEGSFSATKPQRQVLVAQDQKGISARLNKPGRIMRLVQEPASAPESAPQQPLNVAAEPQDPTLLYDDIPDTMEGSF